MSRIIHFNSKTVPLAYEALKSGELVVLPTDTVYGVAAGAWSDEAVDRLFEAKGRPANNPIPVLLSDADVLEKICAEVPEAARRLAEAFWPGPLTIALAKVPGLPRNLTPLATVGVRMPDHDLTRALIRLMGGALAVTSANLSGGPNPLTVQEAYLQLGSAVTYYLEDGPAPGGQPSTVITFDDVGGFEIVRQGPLSEADLRTALA
jgi:L-threonylcarbamoyladenylate synthase